jgi:hypothetical protein
MCFNANGLSGKADSIHLFADRHKSDFVFVVETWLKPGSSPVFKNVFLNLTRTVVSAVAGGRRHTGGILGYSPTGKQNDVRGVFLHPEGHFALLEIDSVLVAICYFPPSLEDEVLDELFEQVELHAGDEKEVLLLGDFNARMGTLTEDSVLTRRGRKLAACLDDSRFFVCRPTYGRNTTVTRHGGGVTDLVIASVGTHAAMQSLIVHEKARLGGSDHRPLTFSLSLRAQRVRKEFARWNVRKLMDPDIQELFKGHLLLNVERIELLLTDFASRLRERERDRETMDRQFREQWADRCWEQFALWIENALGDSCGELYYSSNPSPGFWTEELLAKQAALDEMDGAAGDTTEAAREFRRLCTDQRYKLFQEECERLGDPQFDGSFLKMIKGKHKRTTRPMSALDVAKLDSYADHFGTTFGADPTGSAARKDANLLRETDPRREECEVNVDLFFTPSDLRYIIGNVSLGKAAGCDGLMAEAFKYGVDIIIGPLSQLFQLFAKLQCVPTEWRQALIVLAYKKKGSLADVANYRPIALTCVCRRLYERLVQGKLSEATKLLDDFQGGFRAQRSTHQQIFVMDQVLKNSPNAISMLMDLKAAYDLVDRDILWTDLHHHFQVPLQIIKILRSLFDCNFSKLVLQGSFSKRVDHARGLLQGSSLSPILFNMFIDSLLRRMRRHPKVQTCGLLSNCLFFADDANLHAMTKAEAQAILVTCEEWSDEYGMRFAPTKCFVLCSRRVTLKLYGVALPRVTVTKYLGVFFSAKGIDWPTTINELAKKARGIVGMMVRLGFNGTGWPPRSCVNVFKTFIRPLWEYVLQLGILPRKYLQRLQCVQNYALRTMFTAARCTSSGALHRLTLIETVALRNEILTAKFAEKLHNSCDSRIPAVMLWRRLHERDRNALKLDGSRTWDLITKNDHLLHAAVPRESWVKTSLTTKKRDKLRYDDLENLTLGRVRVANAIEVDKDLWLPKIMKSGVLSDRKIRRNIFNWRLGNVCRHQLCKKCNDGTELSRKHGLECSGALRLLEEKYAADFDLARDIPALDQVLNVYLFRTPHPLYYAEMSSVVSRVMSQCLKMRQKDNGFWEDPEAAALAPPAGPVVLNVQVDNAPGAPRPGGALAPRIVRPPRPRARRQPAFSNPVGRPRRQPLPLPARQEEQGDGG